jgi:uncharacterized membrane protein (UPF0127 family)
LRERSGIRLVIIIGVFALLLFLVAYEALSTPGDVNLQNPPTRFTANGSTFSITYIATDQHSREVGLMNRKITNTTSMLFVFPSFGVYSFWMSGVNSSLDIVWLNMSGETGRVVYIAPSIPACNPSVVCPTYTPSQSASWVLEVQGGFCEAHGITIGSEIGFS